MGSSPILGTILKTYTANLFNFCDSQKVKTFSLKEKIMGSIPICNNLYVLFKNLFWFLLKNIV